MYKFIGLYILFLAAMFYLYLVFFSKKRIEGLDTMTPTTVKDGIGINADAYSSAIQTNFQALKDKLLIPQYRPQYDAALVGVSDYIHMLMLQSVLQIDVTTTTLTEANMKLFANINTLNEMQNSLNSVSKFTDASS